MPKTVTPVCLPLGFCSPQKLCHLLFEYLLHPSLDLASHDYLDALKCDGLLDFYNRGIFAHGGVLSCRLPTYLFFIQ